MPKGKSDERPSVLDLTAGELVALLVEEAGETIGTLATATEIDRAALSRFRSGQRQANESDYRILAKYAVRQKIVKID